MNAHLNNLPKAGKENLHFFRRFLRNPLQVGAVAPSSQKLARAMIRDLSLNYGDTLLELGPGTGALTYQIRRILPDSTAYFGIECEPRFVKLLQQTFPKMHFVKGRAEQANELYRDYNLSPVKVIISGIPFANHWNEESRNHIIATLDELMSPGCVFRTFQYVHAYTLPPALRFRKEMSDHFGQFHRSRIVMQNLPPAFVLTWKK